MTRTLNDRLAALCLFTTLVVSSASSVSASDHGSSLKLSVGAAFQARNDVQIPNNSLSTRFALDDIAGSGPFPGARVEGIWNINETHGVRVLLAPLSYSEVNQIDDPITFNGATFSADEPVTGEYTFNSWRVGYRYHLQNRKRWDLWLGGTLKIRDAEIRLVQGSTSAMDDDLGFVPLLHIAWRYQFSDHWQFAGDVDALGGGPGRAIDLGLSMEYSTGSHWLWGVEYRALEGGADTDDVYNFAWFNSFLLTSRYLF